MNNAQIRDLLKKTNIYQWQVAEHLGMPETSLSRWFRKELTQEQQDAVLKAIQEIEADRTQNS